MNQLRTIRRRGGALFIALVTLLVVMVVTMTLVQSIIAVHRQTRLTANQLQAEWLAEAGVARALVLSAVHSDDAGETWKVRFGDAGRDTDGIVEIKVTKTEGERGRIKIDAIAHYPDDPLHRAAARREYTLAVP